MCTDTKIAQENATVEVNKHVGGLDVPMNLTHLVEVLDTLQNLLQNSCHEHLILDSVFSLNLDHIMHRTRSKNWHYKPQIGLVDEADVVADDVGVLAGRHDIDLLSNIVHITILEEFHVHNLDSHFFVFMWRISINHNCLPNQTEGTLSDWSNQFIARCF